MKDEIKVLESILFRLYCDSPISKKYGLELDKNECKLLSNYITNLQEENVSLNNQLEFIGEQNKYIDKLENIIDELEKWLKEYMSLLEAGDICEETTQDTLKEVLDKIKELKGE